MQASFAIRAAAVPLFLLLASGCSLTAAVPEAPPTADAVSNMVWEQDMARFGAADAISPPPPGTVLFIGSSSIRMWSTLARCP